MVTKEAAKSVSRPFPVHLTQVIPGLGGGRWAASRNTWNESAKRLKSKANESWQRSRARNRDCHCVSADHLYARCSSRKARDRNIGRAELFRVGSYGDIPAARDDAAMDFASGDRALLAGGFDGHCHSFRPVFPFRRIRPRQRTPAGIGFLACDLRGNGLSVVAVRSRGRICGCWVSAHPVLSFDKIEEFVTVRMHLLSVRWVLAHSGLSGESALNTWMASALSDRLDRSSGCQTDRTFRPTVLLSEGLNPLRRSPGRLLCGAFSQSTFAALLFRSSATTVAVPGMPAIGTAVGVTNMQGFRTARREGKTGVRARVTRLVWRALPYPGLM